MNKLLFGTLPTGENIYKFTLENECASAEIISRGATITSFKPFGKEIIAGFDTLGDYLMCKTYHGATIGRVCNRIVGASFEMGGTVYELTRNNGEHCLHGGSDGFHDKAWQIIDYGRDFVELGYLSPDGQSGFPGEVSVVATFTLVGAALVVEYTAIPDKRTPIMLTTHGYFNLDSFSGSVEGHLVKMHAKEYSGISAERLPTGERASVVGTPLDFTEPRSIGERVGDSPIGYDHNFIISGEHKREYKGKALRCAAEVWGKELKLTAYTDQPGVHFYVFANKNLTAPALRGGIAQTRYSAFCLEPQVEPNCVKRGIGFYEADEVYSATIIYEVEKI